MIVSLSKNGDSCFCATNEGSDERNLRLSGFFLKWRICWNFYPLILISEIPERLLLRFARNLWMLNADKKIVKQLVAEIKK